MVFHFSITLFAFRSFITLEKTAFRPAWRGVEQFARKRSLNLEHLFRFLQPFF